MALAQSIYRWAKFVIDMLHVLTEERSFQPVFERIVSDLFPNGIPFKVHPHQGKQDLLRALKTVVPILSRQSTARILVAVDQDFDNCLNLKSELQEALQGCTTPYKIRIVCRDLECWFLGDFEAIGKAYPRFKPSLYSSKARFRDVDAIPHSASAILKIVPELFGRKHLPKIEFSGKVSEFLTVDRNRSVSFGHMVSAIRELTN